MISMLHTEFRGRAFLCARKEYNVLWADETSLKLKKQQRKKMEKKKREECHPPRLSSGWFLRCSNALWSSVEEPTICRRYRPLTRL